MTIWEYVRQLDKEGFARWLTGYSLAINGVEEATEEDFYDLIELACRALDEEVPTITCEHHDISRED